MPISIDDMGDGGGVRFMELNGDGFPDMLFHRRWNDVDFKGAYLNTGNGWMEEPAFEPLKPVSIDRLSDGGVRFVDVNADGLSDMLYYRWLNSEEYKGAYLNTGSGWREAPSFHPVEPISINHVNDGGGVRFVELNGDGLPDMVYYHWWNDIDFKGAYVNTGSGWRKESAFEPVKPIAIDTISDAGVRFPDLNGDGRADMVFYRSDGTEVYKGAYLNTGSGWKEHPEYEPVRPITIENGLDGGVRFVDVNGDGLPDMLFYRWWNSQEYKGAYLNTGRGWKEHPSFTPVEPISINNVGDGGGVRFVELNGDGLPDMVFHHHWNGIDFKGAYLNRGNGWSELPAYESPKAIQLDDIGGGVRFLDLDANGQTDVLYSRRWDTQEYKGAHLNRLSRPDLLVSISSGKRSVRLEYVEAVREPRALLPENNRPRFFAQAPARHLLLAVEEAASGEPYLRTEYSYENAVFHLAEDRRDRRNLGFERVTTRKFAYERRLPVPFPEYEVAVYDHDPDNAGRLLRHERRLSNDVAVRTRQIEYHRIPRPGFRTQVVPRRVRETLRDADGAKLHESMTVYGKFDGYGNPMRIDDYGDTGFQGDDTVRLFEHGDENCPYLPTLSELSDRDGNLLERTERRYDARCRPVTVVEGFNGALRTSHRAYADRGRLFSETEYGATTRYKYEGDVTTVELPDGSTVEFETDPATGFVLWEKAPDGVYTVREYVRKFTHADLEDGGSTTSVRHGTGAVQSVTMDVLGRRTSVTETDDRGEFETTFEYDHYGRLTRSVVGQTVLRQLEYDRFGRLSSETIPGAGGPVVRAADHTPTRVAVGERFGLESETTDPSGRKTYEVRDLHGNLLRRDQRAINEREELWERLEVDYDARNLPVLLRRGFGADRNAISFSPERNVSLDYDALGRKVARTDAGGTVRQSYDPDTGKLFAITGADGGLMRYHHDSAGRLLRTDAGGKTLVQYEYGAGSHVRRIVDEGGERFFDYDGETGRLSHVRHSFTLAGEAFSFESSFEYDDQGRLSRRAFPGAGLALEYEWFDTGALRRILLDDPGGRFPELAGRALATYESLSRHNLPGRLVYANGATVDWTYQRNTGSIAGMKFSSGGGLAMDLEYAYQNDGLLGEIRDLLDPARSRNYRYDVSKRLSWARGPYGTPADPVREIEYRHAADGPLLWNGETEANHSYEGSQKLSDAVGPGGRRIAAYSYDGAGRVAEREASSGRRSFLSYRADGRVREIRTVDPDGFESVTDFSYLGDGKRFRKTWRAGDTEVTTLYFGTDYRIRKSGSETLHTLLVRKPDGALATLTFAEDLPVARGGGGEGWPLVAAGIVVLLRRRLRSMGELSLPSSRAWLAGVVSCVFFLQQCAAIEVPAGSAEDLFETYVSEHLGAHFYVSDHLDSNRLVLDVSGKVVASNMYSPYGRLNLELSENDPDGDGREFNLTEKFTGQEYDYETGLYNYNARLYDPETGRFLSTDPKHRDIPGASNFDRYGYVHGNPVNLTDPSGEIAVVAAMLGGLNWAMQSSAAALWRVGAGLSGGFELAEKTNLIHLFGDNEGIGAAMHSVYNQFADFTFDLLENGQRALAGPVGGAVQAGEAAKGGLAGIWHAVHEHPWLLLFPGVANMTSMIVKGMSDAGRIIRRNIDQTARRIGETWEQEFLRTRHPNMRWDSGPFRAVHSFGKLFHPGYMENWYDIAGALGGYIDVGGYLTDTTWQGALRAGANLVYDIQGTRKRPRNGLAVDFIFHMLSQAVPGLPWEELMAMRHQAASRR